MQEAQRAHSQPALVQKVIAAHAAQTRLNKNNIIIVITINIIIIIIF